MGDQHNISNAVTDKLFTNLSPMLVDPISIPEPSVEDEIQSELEKFIQQKPYNIVVLGQRGVGKRTTVKALFGLSDSSKVFSGEETNVVINSLRPKEGVEILIYDNKSTDNDEYFLDALLPDCDLILYIIDVSSRDMHKDFRLLKEHVLPICERNNQLRNLILAFNKIDIMGECITPNNQELRWDVFNNEPTEKLKSVIKCRLIEIFEQLIAEKLVAVDEHTINPEQVMYFSAEYEYNLQSFLHYVIRPEHNRLTPLMWFLSKQKRVYMDEKEKSEYQKLTEENRDLYDSIKKRHPKWSHEQIFINVGCGYRGLIVDTPTKESLWDKIKKMFK